MSALIRSLLIFVGAGVGGNARYWLGAWVSERIGTTFPWGTFMINVSGAFVIGLAAGIMLSAGHSPRWWLLIVVGFLGGYTTFSSFSLETLNLVSQRSYLLALANVFGSCLAGFLAAWLGRILANLVVPRF